MIRWNKILLFGLFLSMSSFQWANAQQDPREEFSYSNTVPANLPPIVGTMPLDAILGYAIADSLCRVVTPGDMESLGRAANPEQTLYFLKHFNEIVGHDPVLFWDAVTASHDVWSSTTNTIYVSKYSSFIKGIRIACDRNTDSLGVGTLMTGLSDYILYGVVESVDRFSDGVYGRKDSAFVVQVSVLDTLKGTNFPLSCSYPNSLTSIDNCFKFGGFQYRYVGQKYTIEEPGTSSRGYSDFSVGDTIVLFSSLQYFGTHKMSVEPFGFYNEQGGILRVENGRVNDENNAFGLGTSPSVSAFLSKVHSIMQTIKSAPEPGN